MWTDPPYGVDYVGKTKDALTIEGDGARGLDALLVGAFAMADTALEAGAAIYIAHPAGALSVTFGVRFLEQGWKLRQTLVWLTDTMVLGHADYHYKHEPILFGYKPGAGAAAVGVRACSETTSRSRCSTFPGRSRVATMKPVALIGAALENSTAPGDVVLDPFGGSGSTLMACEHLGRRARLVELDPRYCDVIVRRWEEHTGGEAELVEG